MRSTSTRFVTASLSSTVVCTALSSAATRSMNSSLHMIHLTAPPFPPSWSDAVCLSVALCSHSRLHMLSAFPWLLPSPCPLSVYTPRAWASICANCLSKLGFGKLEGSSSMVSKISFLLRAFKNCRKRERGKGGGGKGQGRVQRRCAKQLTNTEYCAQEVYWCVFVCVCVCVCITS